MRRRTYFMRPGIKFHAHMTYTPTLDAAQEILIESVHRGFLYQHLYAAACLLNYGQTGATSVAVERDEDIELVTPAWPTQRSLAAGFPNHHAWCAQWQSPHGGKNVITRHCPFFWPEPNRI